jgi:hypothetical protein
MVKIAELKGKVKTLESQDAPMPVRMDAIAEVNKEWKNIKETEINRVLKDAAFEAGHEIHHIARGRTSFFFHLPPLDK